ncbi:MAG: type II toxin-antitoxin system VapC family toxin [Alphaproteobacteria bacterium]|nr:type II toxin-antitoxin system VapC family toxin [Alphaproteobacteria bacterium]
MNFLVDTHLLIWAAQGNPKLSHTAAEIISSNDNHLWVSAVSLWEIALKRGMARGKFNYDVAQFRAGLLSTGYLELSVEGRHILALSAMPMIRSDPFDRLLNAQAISEGMRLLTADLALGQYGDHVVMVR